MSGVWNSGVWAPALWRSGLWYEAAGFPTQYAGFRVLKAGAATNLCLVAQADAPSGMGGVMKFRKGGVAYAVYLVETNDAHASAVRIKTATGIKAIRLAT